MLILAIDTAGATGGILLARCEGASFSPGESSVLGERTFEPREFSRQFISAVADLFHSNNLRLADLDVFAVISGPGAFTGLRVGLSAVKALAEVTSKPVIALSRLAVLASAAGPCSPEQNADLPTHAVLDAGRGEFYHGIYRDSGRTCVAELLETPAELAASLKTLPGPIAVSESAVSQVLKLQFGLMLWEISCLSVREALPLAMAAWQERRFSDVVQLDANYLRRMDPKVESHASVELRAAESGEPRF